MAHVVEVLMKVLVDADDRFCSLLAIVQAEELRSQHEQFPECRLLHLAEPKANRLESVGGRLRPQDITHI